MSILMDALKQQTHAGTPASGSALWRNIALILALLLALMVGAIAGYMLLPKLAPETSSAVIAEAPAEPALPVHIFDALTDETVSSDNTPTQIAKEAKTEQIDKPVTDAKANVSSTKAVEEFPAPKPVVTVTAQQHEQTDNNTPATADTEVSEELRDKFALALKATEQQDDRVPIRNHNAPARDINMLDHQLQQQIPPLKFEAHVFATQVAQRWVKVNGKTLQEGQWVTADIKIKEITQQHVLLQLGTQLFSMAALSEWPAT